MKMIDMLLGHDEAADSPTTIGYSLGLQWSEGLLDSGDISPGDLREVVLGCGVSREP
jgi:hypothetical protein